MRNKGEIEAKDIKILLLKLYKKLQTGAISESRANKEAYILNSIIKSIEATDLQERIDKIEGLMSRSGDV
jgi:hypothetical protein